MEGGEESGVGGAGAGAEAKGLEAFGSTTSTATAAIALDGLPTTTTTTTAITPTPTTITAIATDGLPMGTFIRTVDFNSDAIALNVLRRSTLIRCSAVGGIERDVAYWKQWIPATTRGGALVLVDRNSGEIYAYVSIVAREGVLRVYDWALAAAFAGGLEGGGIIRALLSAAVIFAPGFEMGDHSKREVSVVMPMILARDALGVHVTLEIDHVLSDDGWMARTLGDESGAGALNDLYEAAKVGTFLVLAADGF